MHSEHIDDFIPCNVCGDCLSCRPHKEEEAITLEADIDLPAIPRTEFITGEAGTGKTWLVRERAKKYPGHVLCATTGIAAVNLGEGVTTINALLGYFDTASLRDAWTAGYAETKLMNLVDKGGLRQIVIDEVSMMDADQLWILTQLIDSVNERRDAASLPGVGITLVADFNQLGPIKAKYAFQSDVWPRYAENTTKLTEVRRQADKPFIEALQAARVGNGKKALAFFRTTPGFQAQSDSNFDGVTILAKNDEVDRFNLFRMSKLTGSQVQFGSSRTGKERPEWKLIPEKLELKIGALVMILTNKRLAEALSLLYANGDIGTLMEVNGNLAMVELKRNGAVVPVEYIRRDNKIPLESGRRKELKESGQQEKIAEKYEIVGSVTYMPLRVAYASSVHKTQGLSMDRVQIDFRNSFFSNFGSLYVALSRGRTAEGLRLVGTEATFLSRCKTSPEVAKYP